MEGKGREFVLVALLAVLVAALGSCAHCRGGDGIEEVEQLPVVVHVSGQVANPGVYELDSDARVMDAIDAAGGGLETADLHRLNLAEFVHDGQRIHVPALPGENPEEEDDGRININTADQFRLQQLPGIGPALAARIVDYRERHGGFASIEDIMKVSGIGEATFENIREYISVD